MTAQPSHEQPVVKVRGLLHSVPLGGGKAGQSPFSRFFSAEKGLSLFPPTAFRHGLPRAKQSNGHHIRRRN